MVLLVPGIWPSTIWNGCRTAASAWVTAFGRRGGRRRWQSEATKKNKESYRSVGDVTESKHMDSLISYVYWFFADLNFSPFRWCQPLRIRQGVVEHLQKHGRDPEAISDFALLAVQFASSSWLDLRLHGEIFRWGLLLRHCGLTAPHNMISQAKQWSTMIRQASRACGWNGQKRKVSRENQNYVDKIE